MNPVDIRSQPSGADGVLSDDIRPDDHSEKPRGPGDRVDDAVNIANIVTQTVDIVLDVMKSPFDC